MTIVSAVQSVVMTFAFRTQSVSIVQKSISATYHSDGASGSNSRKFDYVESESNAKYRFTRKSQESIRNDRIIFTQNARRQKNYVKNFQQKYQEFYDDYNHSSATYGMQNQSKYNDYHFQSIQLRFSSESRERAVSTQSNYNDYYQQSVQPRLPPRSRKKDVLYSFRKKIDVHHISKKNRRLNTMTNEKRYIFASSNRNSNSYRENTRFVLRKSRRLMIVSEIAFFKRDPRDVYSSSESRRFQSAYEVNSETFANGHAQSSTWRRSESDAHVSQTEQHFYESSLESFLESFLKSSSKFSPSESSSAESISYSGQSQSYQIKSVRLKSQEIMKFDFDVNSIVFFIRRFQFITQIKEKAAVLKILFMCLKNSALEWHISLSEIIRTEMQSDLKIWKNELLREYRSNQFKFMKEVRKFIFIFDELFNLSIYLFRKINLLYDEEQIDELQMIHHLWNDLKPQLALVIFIRQNEDTLKSFDRRIRVNEKIARKIHNQMKAEKTKERTKKYFKRNKFKYEKTYEKKSWDSDDSAKRIQKLLNKIFFKTKFWIRIKKIKIKTFRKPLNTETENSTKTKKFSSKKKKSSRSCKWYEDNHWDANCKSNKKKFFLTRSMKKAMRISFWMTKTWKRSKKFETRWKISTFFLNRKTNTRLVNFQWRVFNIIIKHRKFWRHGRLRKIQLLNNIINQHKFVSEIEKIYSKTRIIKRIKKIKIHEVYQSVLQNAFFRRYSTEFLLWHRFRIVFHISSSCTGSL